MPDRYHPDELIAALATPPLRSALALIRTSGPGAIDAVASLFSAPDALRRSAGGRAHHGMIVRPKTGEAVDEVVIVVYRSPASYTGEDSVEITPHGSLPGVRAILDLLFTHGFREAAPGEFTLRAVLKGKMDLTRAEAVREIVDAKTGTAHSMALARLGGGLSDRFSELRKRLLDLIAPVELALDYPEEETDASAAEESDAGYPFDHYGAAALVTQIDSLLDGYRVGRIYQEGARVVIAGATNAGKSSLYNLLVREERSIVSESHGTTRDYIESWISLRGVPLRLFDTAGFRESGEAVESEGIRRTDALLADADLIVYLVDASVGISALDRKQLERIDANRVIVVWSKCDLTGKPAPEGAIALSVLERTGFESLEDRLFSLCGGVREGEIPLCLESDHQRRTLAACRDGIARAIAADDEGFGLDAIAADLSEASRALGELVGDIGSAEILEAIFSKFCVGK